LRPAGRLGAINRHLLTADGQHDLAGQQALVIGLNRGLCANRHGCGGEAGTQCGLHETTAVDILGKTRGSGHTCDFQLDVIHGLLLM